MALRLPSKRESIVFVNHSQIASRAFSLYASSAERTRSSQIRKSQPKPVAVPPGLVARYDTWFWFSSDHICAAASPYLTFARGKISLKTILSPIFSVWIRFRTEREKMPANRSLYEAVIIRQAGFRPNSHDAVSPAVRDLPCRGGALITRKCFGEFSTKSSIFEAISFR